MKTWLNIHSTLWVLTLLALTCMANAATVTTDLADYPPGSTAIITGSGFQAGEEVQLQVLNLTYPEDIGAEHDPWTVPADAGGNFTTTWFVTDDEANTALQLTATGLTSGLTAQTTFTDSASVVTPASATISADTAGGAYTALTGPILNEGAQGDIHAPGTIVLNAPAGFVFDTSSTVTVTVSRLNGSSGALVLLSNSVATVTSSTITIGVKSDDGNTGSPKPISGLTWSGIKVRPTAGTPLKTGSITNSGTATITGLSSSTSFGTLTEVPGAATAFTLAGYPNPRAAGQPGTFTNTVKDQFGNVATNYTGTVHFTSSDSLASLPANYQYTAADAGVHVFTGSTFGTAGTQSLTATDINTNSLTGTQSGIIINGGTVNKLVFSTQPAGAVYKTAFTTQPVIRTQDAYGNNSTNGLPAHLTVTLALTTGTGPLVGTTNLDIGMSGGAGVASYSGLQINRAENGDVLTASAAGYTSASSTAFNVSKASATVSVASSLNPSGYKAGVSFTATLPSDATGSVVFATTNAAFSTNTLSGGSANSAMITLLPRGTNTITAQYAGDSNYSASVGNLVLGQIVTNHPPVAGNFVYTNSVKSFKLIIASVITNNVTDQDNDSLSLVGLGVSTNGITVQTNALMMFYSNGNYCNDQFTYSVTDNYGGSSTGTISVVFDPFNNGTATAGQPGKVTPNPNGASIRFYGIPGYRYYVQRTTNLVDWATLGSTNAASNGVVNFNDHYTVPPAAAFYRLVWLP